MAFLGAPPQRPRKAPFGLSFRCGAQRSLALFPIVVAALAAAPACYDEGDGTNPPTNSLYFPVGLQVSHGGTALYVINADFDLQYNGGTLQAYDLRSMRQDALKAIVNPADPSLPLLRPAAPGCPTEPPVLRTDGTQTRQTLGETCAPPVNSVTYFRDSAIVGAFATDLLMSPLPSELVIQAPKVHAQDPVTPAVDTANDRLFAPVRGNATLTWADVVRDDFTMTPDAKTSTRDNYAPFKIQCGQDAQARCDHAHAVGQDTQEAGNTRHILLPGEPFGLTIGQDGTTLVMTHQNEPKTTLFTSGMGPTIDDGHKVQPALQYYTPNSPLGGIGVASIPHDPDAFLGAPVLPKPAYLMTSRDVAQVSLFRQYSDENGNDSSSVQRPFIALENAYSVAASQGSTDSRGIVIDDTPRRRCKAKITTTVPAEYDKQAAACAKKPARAFIANRTPAALLVGEIGGPAPAATDANAAYDPDRLTISESWPVSTGPSQVYLAPIVDTDGSYALRVFVICFDSAKVYVFNPDAGTLENVITVGIGPFAMAFDPFNMDDVATNQKVPIDNRDTNIRRYRFAYVASFTQSYLQLLDLDNAVALPNTYESIVYTVGLPTNPKGS